LFLSGSLRTTAEFPVFAGNLLKAFDAETFHPSFVAAKVILSTLPEADEDTRQAAAARGKLRYSRFIKSVGANMVGDAHAALSELVDRVPE